MYSAHCNLTGETPEDDGSDLEFETAQEAWAYLAQDHQLEGGDPAITARLASQTEPGTLQTPIPGYPGDGPTARTYTVIEMGT